MLKPLARCLFLLSLFFLVSCDSAPLGSSPSRPSPTATHPPSPPPVSVYFSSGGGVFALNAADGTVRWHDSINASSPVLVQGVVYVTASDGKVYALSAGDGSMRWQVQIPHLMSAPLVIKDNLLFVATNDDTLVALNLSDGSTRWRFSHAGEVLSASNGVAYVSADQVYALNTSDGSVRWSYRSPGDSTLLWTIADTQVYVEERHGGVASFATNVLHVLNAQDGKEQWSFSPGKTQLGLVGTGNGMAYLLSDSGNTTIPNVLYALDTSTGAIGWHSKLQDPGSQATFVNGTLFITAQNNAVSALKASDGKALWHHTLATKSPYPVSPTVIAADANVVYLYNFDTGLEALHADNGSEQWSYPTLDAIGNAFVVNGILYTAGTIQDHSDTGEASAFALRSSDGKTLWRYDIGTETGVPSITTG